MKKKNLIETLFFTLLAPIIFLLGQIHHLGHLISYLGILLFIIPIGIWYTSFVGFITFTIINSIIAVIFHFFFKDSNIFVYVILFSTILSIYWTYNVTMEINKRIENQLPKMTIRETNNIGFKNIGNLVSNILISLFLTLAIAALLIITKIIDDKNLLLPIIIFAIIFVFFLVKPFSQKDKGKKQVNN